MADENTQALHERFELLKGAEHHKNSLIEVCPTMTISTEQPISFPRNAPYTAHACLLGKALSQLTVIRLSIGASTAS